MAKGSGIILASEPRGVFLEGIISGTDKPGTVMQVLAATEPVGERFTWTVFDAAADGDQRLIAVLLPKDNEGGLATAAYVTGDRCFLYIPAMGEELNMLVANVGGTGDSFAISDIMMVDDGTGKLIATTGGPESEPFIIMETVAALTADTLVRCMFTGY